MNLPSIGALLRQTCAAAALLCAQAVLAQPIWTAATLPYSGVVEGPAGTTVGWGYEIANEDGARWLMLTGVSADPFQYGTPIALFDLPVLAPGALVSTPFDGLAGLYGLNWDLDAPDGFINVGNFILTGEWWSGDPLAGGQFLEQAETLALAYSAMVTQQGEVPLPSSALLLLAGAGAWLLVRRLPAGVHRSIACSGPVRL